MRRWKSWIPPLAVLFAVAITGLLLQFRVPPTSREELLRDLRDGPSVELLSLDPDRVRDRQGRVNVPVSAPWGC